jgi:hypothetical protein
LVFLCFLSAALKKKNFRPESFTKLKIIDIIGFQYFVAAALDLIPAAWDAQQGCQMVYIFVPKIPISGYFGGPWYAKFGVFHCYLVYFMTICYIFWSFVVIWYIFPVLVC